MPQPLTEGSLIRFLSMRFRSHQWIINAVVKNASRLGNTDRMLGGYRGSLCCTDQALLSALLVLERNDSAGDVSNHEHTNSAHSRS